VTVERVLLVVLSAILAGIGLVIVGLARLGGDP